MALKDKYYRFFILLLVLLQIVGIIFKFDLTFITFLVCILIFALGITRLSNSFKIATAIFIVAGIVIIVASLLNVKPTTISLRWNWLFCIMFAILGLFFSVLFSLI